jgi:hypothetical protein
MSTRDLIKGILSGEYDDDFQEIEDAVKARQNTLRKINRPEPTPRRETGMRPGDVVRINNNCGTRYLAGRHVKITDRLQKNFRIELLDGPMGRFTSGTLKCPPSLLEWIK